MGSLDEQLPFSPELPLAYIALARRCWSTAPMQRPAMRVRPQTGGQVARLCSTGLHLQRAGSRPNQPCLFCLTGVPLLCRALPAPTLLTPHARATSRSSDAVRPGGASEPALPAAGAVAALRVAQQRLRVRLRAGPGAQQQCGRLHRCVRGCVPHMLGADRLHLSHSTHTYSLGARCIRYISTRHGKGRHRACEECASKHARDWCTVAPGGVTKEPQTSARIARAGMALGPSHRRCIPTQCMLVILCI